MYNNVKLAYVRRVISSILVITFLATSCDLSLAQEVFKESRDALAPSSRFSPLARTYFSEKENKYFTITDAGSLRQNTKFKQLTELLYANNLAIVSAGEALHLKLSQDGVSELMERRLYSYDLFNSDRTHVTKNEDGSIRLVLKDGLQHDRVLRCFLSDENKPSPGSVEITISDKKTFWVEDIDGKPISASGMPAPFVAAPPEAPVPESKIRDVPSEIPPLSSPEPRNSGRNMIALMIVAGSIAAFLIFRSDIIPALETLMAYTGKDWLHYAAYRSICALVGHKLAIRYVDNRDRHWSRYALAIFIESCIAAVLVPFYYNFIRLNIPDLGLWSHSMRPAADLFIFALPMAIVNFSLIGLRDRWMDATHAKAASMTEWIRSAGPYVKMRIKQLFGRDGFFKVMVLFWMPICHYLYYSDYSDIQRVSMSASMMPVFAFIAAVYFARKSGEKLTDNPKLNKALEYSHLLPVAFVAGRAVVMLYLGNYAFMWNAVSGLLTTGVGLCMYKVFDWIRSLLFDRDSGSPDSGDTILNSRPVDSNFAPFLAWNRYLLRVNEERLIALNAKTVPILYSRGGEYSYERVLFSKVNPMAYSRKAARIRFKIQNLKRRIKEGGVEEDQNLSPAEFAPSVPIKPITPEPTDKAAVSLPEIQELLSAIERSFFEAIKKTKLWALNQFFCSSSSKLLAKIISYKFNLPVGGQSPYRIEFIPGYHHASDGDTFHLWLAIYLGAKEPALFIDGSHVQFDPQYRGKIIVRTDYQQALRDLRLEDARDTVRRHPERFVKEPEFVEELEDIHRNGAIFLEPGIERMIDATFAMVNKSRGDPLTATVSKESPSHASATTHWVRRIFGLNRSSRGPLLILVALVIAPFVEEFIYREIPLLISQVFLSFTGMPTAPAMIILASIPLQAFSAFLFLRHHKGMGKILPLRKKAAPIAVNIINGFLLPLIISGSLDVFGLNIFLAGGSLKTAYWAFVGVHSAVNLAILIINANVNFRDGRLGLAVTKKWPIVGMDHDTARRRAPWLRRRVANLGNETDVRTNEWRTLEDAVRSVYETIHRERPDITERYTNLDKLSAPARKMLEEDIYGITAGHIQAWGLSYITHEKLCPYFNGKHSLALLAAFPKLNLNCYGFGVDYSTRDSAAESARFVIRREVPYTMERYNKIELLRPDQISALKDDICAINASHIQAWGLSGLLGKKNAPWFEGSYYNILTSIFNSTILCLTSEDIAKFRKRHRVLRYSWVDGEEQAIVNITDAFEKNRPDIIKRYLKIDDMSAADKELLHRDVIKLSSGHLKSWGINTCYHNIYKGIYPNIKSHADLLIVVFPKLGLNKMDFEWDWSSPDAACQSIRFALRKNAPIIMSDYDKYETLSTDEAQLLALRVYRLTAGHFGAWGLYGALKKETTPYFNGSHIDALIMALPKLGLDKNGFYMHKPLVIDLPDAGIDMPSDTVIKEAPAETVTTTESKPATKPKKETIRPQRTPKVRKEKITIAAMQANMDKLKAALSEGPMTMIELASVVGFGAVVIRKCLKRDELKEHRKKLISPKEKVALERRLYIKSLVETASRTASELAKICGVKIYVIYNDFKEEILKPYTGKLINGKEKSAIDRRLKIKEFLAATRLTMGEVAKLCGVTVCTIWNDLNTKELSDMRGRLISKDEIRINERRTKIKKLLTENRMTIDDIAAELECSRGLAVKDLTLSEFAGLRDRIIGKREANEQDMISRIRIELNRKEQTLSKLAATLDVGKPTIERYLEKPELLDVLKRIVEPEKESKTPIIKERLEKGPVTLAELSTLTGLGVHTVSSYVSSEETLRPLAGNIVNANTERINVRRHAIRYLITEGITDLDEIAKRLDVSVSLVRHDLKTEEMKDLKVKLEVKQSDADKFVEWYFSGEGLREGESAIVNANASIGIKLIREKRLANFSFSIPDNEGMVKVAMAAETDINHGFVVNIYGLDNSGDIDRTRLISTFKYFKKLGTAERFDLARSDILNVHFGWNNIKNIGRHFDTKINSNGYIWVSARRPEDGIKVGHHFSVPIGKVREMGLTNKKVVGLVEEDPNHGQVINFYLAADYYTKKAGQLITPLATYKYYEGIKSPKSEKVPAVQVDLGELDIMKAYKGEKLSLYGRVASAVINKGNYGSGVCYVTMLLGSDNEVRVQFGVPKRYMKRGALGRRLVLKVEEDINSGQVINVFLQEEFNSSKNPEPIVTYKYFPEEIRHYATGDKKGVCKPINLVVEEILAYYGGDKNLKIDKDRTVALPVMGSGSGIRAEMKKGMKKRVVFFLFPEAAKIFSKIKKTGWRIVASLKEDSDYGVYIDFSRGGKQLGAYRYFPELGRCTVANFGRMALMDCALGNRNAKGEHIAPRVYLYNGVVNMRAHMISVRHGGSDHIISRLGPLAGKTPIFVPVKDDLYGYVINVYDADTYRVNKRSPPKVRMIRYPYSKRLIPIDMIELSRAKEFFEKGFLLTAKSAIGKYLADHPGDVEGKMLSGQIAAKISEIGPASDSILRLQDAVSVEKYAALLADAISSKDLSTETTMLGMAKTVISKNPEDVPLLIECLQKMLDFETGSESSAYVNMAVFKMLSPVPDNYKTVALARSAARIIHYEGACKEDLRVAARSFFASYPRTAMFHKSKSEAMEEFEEMSKGVRLDDPMSQYIRDTAAYPLLTDTGEAVLSSLAHLGDDKAAKEMAASNLRYVISMVRKYIRSYMSLYDLIGAGNDGLLKAVEKFDPTRGFKFSTYATWWIRQSTIRYIQNNYRQIRIPINKQAEMKQFKRECAVLEIDPYDYNISDSEIADSLGMEESEVRLMREMMAGITSLSKPYKEGDADEGPESTIEGSIGVKDAAFEKSDRNEMVDAISREVESMIAESSKLPERDIDIFRKRVLPLFIMENPQTLEEVGAAYGVTRERIRQIEKKIISRHVHRALKKLKLTKKHFLGEYEPPAGSIYSVFKFMLESSSEDKPIGIDGIVAHHGAYDTIKYDLRALYYHLHLITRYSGSGKTARYYVPESVRKKLADHNTKDNLFKILGQFYNGNLRPNPSILDLVYNNDIMPILNTLSSENSGDAILNSGQANKNPALSASEMSYVSLELPEISAVSPNIPDREAGETQQSGAIKNSQAARQEIQDRAIAIREWMAFDSRRLSRFLCFSYGIVNGLLFEGARTVTDWGVRHCWTEIGDEETGWLVDSSFDSAPREVKSTVTSSEKYSGYLRDGVLVLPLKEGRQIYGIATELPFSDSKWRTMREAILGRGWTEDQESKIGKDRAFDKQIRDALREELLKNAVIPAYVKNKIKIPTSENSGDTILNSGPANNNSTSPTPEISDVSPELVVTDLVSRKGRGEKGRGDSHFSGQASLSETVNSETSLVKVPGTDITREVAQAETLANHIKIYASEAKLRGDGIVIGIETRKWMTDRQKADVESTARAIKRVVDEMKRRGMVSNAAVCVGGADGLVSTIAAAQGKVNAPLKNVLILGSKDTLTSKRFDGFRGKSLLACLEPKDLEKLSYVRLFEMLNILLEVNFNGNDLDACRALHKGFINIDFLKDASGAVISERLLLLLPDASAFDQNEPRDTYNLQTRKFADQA